MSTTIYVDECGYTGEDLFNAEQPVFCLASTSLSEEDCAELKSSHLGGVKSQELKHSSLARNPRHRQRTVDLLRDLAQKGDAVKFYIAHKRFALLTKIVDLIIEPLAYEDGVDFYENGFNIAYSNLFYYMAVTIAGDGFFEEMIQKFQRMMRERTIRTYHAFFRLFFDSALPKPFEEHIIFLKGSHLRHGPDAIRAIPPDALDIAFATAFNLVATWSKSTEGDLVIIHDQSSKMAKSKRIWDRVVSPEIPPRVVGKDRRLMHFPLRVTITELGDSKTHAGLQIADILAGAMARCMKWMITGQNPSDEYGATLATFMLEGFGGHMLWPSPKFTPEELGTTGASADDAIDHFVHLTKDLL